MLRLVVMVLRTKYTTFIGNIINKKNMTYQFKIQLKNVSNPTVWRKIVVPSDYTFEEFHKVIQFAFGWEFSHLFFFSPTGYNSQPLIEMNSEGNEFYEAVDEDSLNVES